MTQTFVRIAIIGTTFALAIPLSAQRGPGAGVGRPGRGVIRKAEVWAITTSPPRRPRRRGRQPLTDL